MDWIKSQIPFMHPKTKMHTFRFWVDRVHACLDVMELRLGGSYLQEMKDLRSQNWDLEYIEQYFLAKDLEREQEAMRKAAITEMANKVERVIEMNRTRQKELWGVSIGYNLSADHGLQLVLGTVEPNSPAWKAGLRSGDTIVTVNDWTITLMDKPEVALHLFQASANTVRLGLISGAENMTALGVQVY